MGHRIILAALALPGCILEPRFCGEGFVEADGRCVPASAAPAWYGDGGDPDFAPPDAAPPAPPPDAARPRDAEVPDVRAPDRWSARRTVLIVDRGSRQSAVRTPATPGFDLDAAAVFGPDGEIVGELGEVLEAQINDPFGRSLASRADGALGAADTEDISDTDAYVSLGTEGGYLFAAWSLARPLQAGDRVAVFEVRQDRGSDSAEVYLCLDEVLSLDRCVSIGEVQGTAEIRLRE